MRILMLCGYKRCGKDTFANHLVDNYGYTHLKISKTLKDTLKTLFQFSDDQLETDLKDIVDRRWNITPRKAMVFVGTDLFQHKIQELLPNIGKNFWIKSTKEIIVDLYLKNKDCNIVISDLRFIHELDYINDIKFEYKDITIEIVKIIRPNLQIMYDKDLYESETQHLSFHFDKIITNDDHYIDNINHFMTT